MMTYYDHFVIPFLVGTVLHVCGHPVEVGPVAVAAAQ